MTEPSRDTSRTWAAFTHLSALCGFIVPFGNIIGPLVMWMMKRDQFPFVDQQGKEALNFQISMTIYAIVSAILFIVLIGIILLPIVLLLNIIFTIIAGVKANEGVAYTYPITIRFIK